MERGSAQRFSLKGRERAIVSRTDIKTFKSNVGETSEGRGGAYIWAFPSG